MLIWYLWHQNHRRYGIAIVNCIGFPGTFESSSNVTFKDTNDVLRALSRWRCSKKAMIFFQRLSYTSGRLRSFFSKTKRNASFRWESTSRKNSTDLWCGEFVSCEISLSFCFATSMPFDLISSEKFLSKRAVKGTLKIGCKYSSNKGNFLISSRWPIKGVNEALKERFVKKWE